MVGCLISSKGWLDGKRPGTPAWARLPCTPQSDCTELPLLAEGAEAPLPVYSEPMFANIFCFQFQEELWENLWIKPNAKRWTLFPFPFLSDCFNCSVVVLMDLRPWSGSCLSDFQLLFVNNLKRKKKRNFTFWRQTCVSFLLVQTLYLTLGVLYSFLPFLLENNVKWFHNVKRKKLPLWPNAQSVLQQQWDSINSKSWFSRRNAFSLPCLSFSFLSCFDLQKKMSFLCELVLYYVENYEFYFNGFKKKARRALVAFLTWSQSLCSGLKKKKNCYQFRAREYVSKRNLLPFLCVFPFVPMGNLNLF